MCHACRTYFVRVGMERAHHNVCVDVCPAGTYLDRNSSECTPCFAHCSAEVGCVGPVPYVDRANGCLDCSLVQLDRNGSQVKDGRSYYFCLLIRSFARSLIRLFVHLFIHSFTHSFIHSFSHSFIHSFCRRCVLVQYVMKATMRVY